MPEHTTPTEHPADPALDALLDEALAAPPAPRHLADRITAATTPLLDARRQPVLGRIGWRPVLRMAAAIAVVAAVLLVTWPDHQPATPSDHGQALAQLDELQSHAAAAQAMQFEGFGSYDYRLDMLDLQVALADTADPWTDDGQAINDLGYDQSIEFYFDDASGLF